MFPGNFCKRRQRDLLDAQIYVKRDIDYVCALVVIFFIAVFMGCLGYLKVTFFPSHSLTINNSTSRQSLLHGIQDLEKYRIIVEDAQNMCVAWRDLDGCVLEGKRRPRNDLNCSDPILPSQTGWCDCKDSTGSQFQIEFDCLAVDSRERKETFTCSRMCSTRVQQGLEKSHKLSRAFEASTKRAETLIEIEKRRREEAEQKKSE